MSVCSADFLAICCLGPILFHAIQGKRFRQLALTLFNIEFLLYLISDLKNWFWLFMFVFGSYIVIRCINRKSSSWFLFSAIMTFVVLFVYLKRYSFLTWILPSNLLQEPLQLVGLSYILFKAIHAMVDRWQEMLKPCSFWSYFNYQLSFFTLIAGPIQRYNYFRLFWEEMDLAPRDRQLLIASWIRILSGMFKIGAISSIAWSYFDRGVQSFQHDPAAVDLWQFCFMFYGYPVYLYFNFSGYTDVVIGTALLFGLKLPENFNRPYLARNIIDFWNRWHTTLTHWIRDYVFMTSYKAVAERFPRYSKPAGYFIAFASLLIAGLWHGAATGFAYFGAIHGLGIAMNQMGANALRSSWGGAGFKRYQQNKFIHAAAVLVSAHYVAFGFLFFALGADGAFKILAIAAHGCSQANWQHQAFEWALGIFGTFAAFTLFLAKEDIVIGIGAATKDVFSKTPSFSYYLLLAESVLVSALLFSLWALGQSDPVVVYMKF